MGAASVIATFEYPRHHPPWTALRMPTSQKQYIERYLRHGQHDDFFRAWPGDDFLARAKCGHAALLDALIATVRQRTRHAAVPEALAGIDVVAFTRAKVAPMVRGLFRPDEQETVLDVLGRSVVFVTPDTITTVLAATRWLNTAWDLANLYLESCDAELLGPDARQIVGLSEETTCYVSAEYFRAPSPFADFVVHEAAHIFHNCKRRTIGLREVRGREWLLEIDFRRRETFAYACEAYSRIRECGASPHARRELLADLEPGTSLADDRVDASEYLDILGEAVAARNGWKRILARCAAPQPVRTRGTSAT